MKKKSENLLDQNSSIKSAIKTLNKNALQIILVTKNKKSARWHIN